MNTVRIATVRGARRRVAASRSSAYDARKITARMSEISTVPANSQCSFSKVTQKSVAKNAIAFFATLFCVTFEKLHWEFAGTVEISDILAVIFLASYALERLAATRRRAPRTVAILTVFILAFLLVYLIGYFNLDTTQAVSQFTKGIVKFV